MLAADGKGNVTACRLSGKRYANVSHDAGNTFGPRVEVNPAYDPCNRLFPVREPHRQGTGGELS